MRVQAGPPWVKCLALLQGENSVLVGKPMYRDGLSSGSEEPWPALFETLSPHSLDSHPTPTTQGTADQLEVFRVGPVLRGSCFPELVIVVIRHLEAEL